jgi:hypothetical protein
MGTRKIARTRKSASTSTSARPALVLRNYSVDELTALSEPNPWRALGRQGNRAARKALAKAMDRVAEQAFRAAFDTSFAESMRLKYPCHSSHFMRMFLRAMNEKIQSRMRGSGVRS